MICRKSPHSSHTQAQTKGLWVFFLFFSCLFFLSVCLSVRSSINQIIKFQILYKLKLHATVKRSVKALTLKQITTRFSLNILLLNNKCGVQELFSFHLFGFFFFLRTNKTKKKTKIIIIIK